jgi:tetratricopeptide (TPR) repeat protein
VQTRARPAGPEVETLLRAATVVGAAFDLEVVAGLLELPVDVCARRAGQAMAARLLVEDEAGAGYRFTNDLVREVLYRTSPRPTRVIRHRRLAAMLADRPEAAAGHAAAGDWATAAGAWMAAAAEAARAYANRDAERLLDQAVAAATEAGDPALEAAARLDRGQALVALGDYPAAFADQEQALRLATAHGLDRLEAAALEQLGWTAYYSRDHQAASELTPQARELAERAVAAPRAAPTALLLAARMRHAEGDLAGAREAFDAVLGEPDPATQTTGLTYLGLLLEHADQFAEARRVLDRSIEACRAAGLFRPLLTSCFAATLACANLGDLSGALDRLALLERSGGQLDRPFGYRWRVELRHAELTSRLDPPAAEGLLELARTYGSTKYQALALARLGRRPQALALVAASGSDYLIAQVAPPALARAAIDRIAAALPAELRPAFLRRGHLAAATR